MIATAITHITGSSGLAEAALKRMNDELARLRGEAAALQALVEAPDPTKVEGYGVTPVIAPKYPDIPKTKTSTPKAYENTALDEAYKKLEHLKALDQLAVAEELKMLQNIQSKYVKTGDERMDIEERIYAVKKTMGDASLEKALDDYNRSVTLGKLNEAQEIERLQRIRKLYADSAEERKQIDDMIFEVTQRKIAAEKQARTDAVKYVSDQLKAAYEDRVARENLSDTEAYKLKDKLYNDQIYLNKSYLAKVLADDRYTAAEKRGIERQITEEIRLATNERLQLQKDYAEDTKKAQIDGINDLAKGVQDALKAKYTEEKRLQEDSIKAAQAANEEWKKAQLEVVQSAYKARVKAAEDASEAEIAALDRVLNAQIDAIQAELDALEDAQKQKNRADVDAEDAKKIGQLTSKIDYEHDDYNRAQLQKELNRVLAEQEKRRQEEQLSDKKDVLNEEKKTLQDQLKAKTDAIKQQLLDKKELMEADYEADQVRINNVYEAQKASLEKQLIDTQAHYAKLLEAKNLQAEAEKMIIEDQQKDILKLLTDFGDSYHITGQTLGEKMYQGFKVKVDQISSLIAGINSQIDAARNSAMAVLNQAADAKKAAAEQKAKGAVNSVPPVVQGTVVSVSQTFNTPVTSPSDISRAARLAAQSLV